MGFRDFIDAAAKALYGVDTKAARHRQPEPVYWNKVKMSYDADSDTFQTDNYIGIIGDMGQKSKAHVVVNSEGDVVFVRDIGGKVLYDKKNGIGHLPSDLNWSK